MYSAHNVYKKYYRRFLDRVPKRLHFAAHSHHYWPDVTRDAVLAYWDDSAAHADHKWGYLWQEVIPRAQHRMAGLLRTYAPEQIVFAPNTHEFVNRLISCFDTSRAIRILSTDSEFHSFRRQCMRLQEAGLVELERVPSQPIEDFVSRFSHAANHGDHDLIYLSHVFFNSGLVVEPLSDLILSIPSKPMIVIDGYHGFCALPTSLGEIAERVFYIAGGYKYAQSGEGVCFMHVPTGCELRPKNTGWFADFAGLSASDHTRVQYSANGQRFAGATFDPSGIYRFNAVMDLFEREGITIEDIHRHVVRLQARFLTALEEAENMPISRHRLMFSPERKHGHFLTFSLPTPEQAARLARALADEDVVVDYRYDRLRIGFGMYLDDADIDALIERLARVQVRLD